MPICVALIVAAGRGARLSDTPGAAPSTPKQYHLLGGRPVLSHAVAAFLGADGITAIRVVIHGDDRQLYHEAVGHLDILDPVIGGATRQDSVRAGLESLAGDGFDSVLIHDAARPLLDAALIGRTCAALANHRGVVPALPVADSLMRANNSLFGDSIDRTNLWRAQTPQGFSFAAILGAHRKAAGNPDTMPHVSMTDDAAVAAAAGIEVALVPGFEDNFKITTLEDMARAERLLSGGGETRTGQGFDVHGFGADGSGPVRLCGVDLPHPRGLTGHSDADAALHAATDAILGALAEGDIGSHFPPSDATWKDADSATFVDHAVALLAARDGILVHLDLTIICEHPKIAPHRAAMRARKADILGNDMDRVSIKATTSEELGALGRGEGIAAQAVATIRLGRRNT
jgi:2-C-methyl-D-erythritol 4-phosphate cytidylyltransferase/2-C-methyl-D-erythritol 2,4-cyclodiphosphate synthase